MKNITLVILSCFLMSACSMHMEKRRYSPGFYVSISKNRSHSLKVPFRKGEQKRTTLLPVGSVPTVKSVLVASSELVVSRSNINKVATTANFNHQPVAADNKRNLTKGPVAPPSLEVDFQPKNMEHKASINKTDKWFLTISGFFLALFAGIFRPFVPKTKNLGYLALNNRKLTRGFIFLGHCVLACCGFYLGKSLFHVGVETTDVSTYGLSGVAALTALLYPKRKTKRGFFRNSYVKQKMFSLLMVASGVLLFTNIGNRYEAGNLEFPQTTQYFGKQESTVTALLKPHESLKDEKTHQEKTAINIVLTIVTAIVSLVLCFLIVGLSCSLSCTGQENLAIVLLLVGIPVVVMLSIEVIKSIWKDRKVPKPKPVSGKV